MYVRKHKIRKKCGIRTYYSIAKTVTGKKHPVTKNIRYLGTTEKILKVYKFYDENKEKS